MKYDSILFVSISVILIYGFQEAAKKNRRFDHVKLRFFAYNLSGYFDFKHSNNSSMRRNVLVILLHNQTLKMHLLCGNRTARAWRLFSKFP